MGDISENISETRRLGRPATYGTAHMTAMQAVFPEVQTARGLQNKHFQMRAHGVLKGEPGIEWLMDVARLQQREPGNYRQTILQELGRIDDDDTLKAVARRLF